MKYKYYGLSSGLFEDEDEATTVYCQARLPQISEESSGSEDASDASSECGSEDATGSGFGSSDGAPAKSALTSYSMTSSVLPRNEKLTLLDDMFEKVIPFLVLTSFVSEAFIAFTLDTYLLDTFATGHQEGILSEKHHFNNLPSFQWTFTVQIATKMVACVFLRKC